MNPKVAQFLRDKRRRRALWAAAALGVYALVGFFLLPWVLGKVIPAEASELVGRKVTIQKILLNPFVLSGSCRGVRVDDKDGTTLLSWDEAYANFQLSSIFRWTFTFKEVRLVHPYIHLQINPDYSINISDIVERMQQRSGEAPPNEPTSPPSLRVGRLTITNAVARLSDLTLREPFHRQIGPVNLTLKGFRTDPDNENPYSLSGSTEAGDRFAWRGSFFLFPLRSEGHLSVDNIRLPSYAPLYREFVSLTVADGVINLSGDYRVRFDGTNDSLSVSNAELHLASLEVKTAEERSPTALEVGDLRVSDVEADLEQRRARVGSVVLNGGEVFVRRDKDASINLVKMAHPSNTNAEPAGAVLYAIQAVKHLVSSLLATTNQAIAVVDKLDIKNWAFQLEDDVNARPVRLRIDAIQVHGKNLSNVPGKDLSVNLECRWNTNGTVKVNADGRLFPLHSEAHIQVDRIELPPLGPYAEPFANVLLLDGKFSMEGTARIGSAATHALSDANFEGELGLDDFSIVDGLMGTDLLEWKSVKLSGIKALLRPMGIDIGQIAILGAKARMVVETNRTINILNAMNVGGRTAPATAHAPAGRNRSEASATSQAPEKQMPPATPSGHSLPALTVSSVLVSNATLNVADLSTEPPLRWAVTDIDGEVGGLSSTSQQQASLKMTAKAGRTAPVVIAGRLNPLNPAVDTDILVKLDDMDLLPFAPYAGRYAGYQLRKGSLSLDLKYNVKGRNLVSANQIVVDQLSLGRKVESPEATKLPVKLGVAILKDRNGTIELDIPIQGNLDDPEFRLGRVIGHTLMVTLTKMLSSPFSLLGAIVGGTGEELSTFDFLPGSAALQARATNGLQKLSKALYERPGLEVEIQGSVSPEADGLAIKKQKLTHLLQKTRWEELRESARANTKPEQIALPPDIRVAMLRKCYAQAFPDEARATKPPPGLEDTFYERMTDKLLDQIQLKEDDFRELASARAQTVKTYLIDTCGVEPGRLFLTEEQTATVHKGSKVRLQLE